MGGLINMGLLSWGDNMEQIHVDNNRVITWGCYHPMFSQPMVSSLLSDYVTISTSHFNVLCYHPMLSPVISTPCYPPILSICYHEILRYEFKKINIDLLYSILQSRMYTASDPALAVAVLQRTLLDSLNP
jgi:hypothetical protein